MPEERLNRSETLTRVPIFSGLDDAELAFLAQRTVPRLFSAGEMVFAEGEPCTGLYVVESGHLRIFKSSAGGREHVLAIEGPGSSVAELPVFDGGNYPASVSAIDEATLLFVSKHEYAKAIGPSRTWRTLVRGWRNIAIILKIPPNADSNRCLNATQALKV